MTPRTPPRSELAPLRYTGIGTSTALDLEGYLLGWSEKLQNRLARHTYAKRVGGEQEPMGSDPVPYSFRCAITGSNWTGRYRIVCDYVRRYPRGSLQHPIFGAVNVGCHGITDSTVNQPDEARTVRFTLSFEDDALDRSITTEQVASVQQAHSTVTARASQVKAGAGDFYNAAVLIVACASSAVSYATAAVISATSRTADPSVSVKLAAVGSSSQAAIAAALLEPTFQASPIMGQPMVASLVGLYAACLALDSAIGGVRPVPTSYRVQGPSSLMAIVVKLYGATDGPARLAEVMSNNRIPNPFLIPAGTILSLASPTV